MQEVSQKEKWLCYLRWRCSCSGSFGGQVLNLVWKIQISDTYQKVMSKTSEIPELSEMFEKQSLGRLPRLYLWQLCFRMPNDMIGKVCITIRKKGWKLSITFWWRRNSICWGVDVWCRCNDRSMTRNTLSFLGRFLVLVILRFLPAATSARVGAS